MFGFITIIDQHPKEGPRFIELKITSDTHHRYFKFYLTQNTKERTHLADLWKECTSSGQAVLSDMEVYAPSAGAPAMFVACPVLKNREVVGVVALQISNDAINDIMQEKSGLGESGE